MVLGTGDRHDRLCPHCREETEHRRDDDGNDRCLTCFRTSNPVPPPSGPAVTGCVLLSFIILTAAALRLIPW